MRRVSLAEALLAGNDPFHVITYLAGLGIEVGSLDDLLRTNADDTEEEIRAFPVAEGVAVTVASDGAWQLFEL